MSERILLIKADTNDADYVYSENSIGKLTLKQILDIERIVNVIKEKGRHNWDVSDRHNSVSLYDMYEGILTMISEQKGIFF